MKEVLLSIDRLRKNIMALLKIMLSKEKHMQKIFKSKNILSLIIFIMLGILYIYILNLKSGQISQAATWIVSFIILLLFYYFVFIITTVIQILGILCLNLFPIKVFSLYPVTFDGTWRFHPVNLIYNIEGYSNSLILNLALFIHDKSLLMKKMKQLLILRKASILLTYCLVFLILRQYDIKTILVLSIAAISTILLSYFQYGSFWYGYDYLYNEGSDILKEYIEASKSIMILTANQYAVALKETHNDPVLELAILDNYLYRSILERSDQLSAQLVESTISKYMDPDHFFLYHLTLDTKRLNSIKLIGWTGYKLKNREVIEISIDQYTKVYEYVVNNSYAFFTKAYKNMRNELNTLKSQNLQSSNELHLQKFQNVFSCYDAIL